MSDRLFHIANRLLLLLLTAVLTAILLTDAASSIPVKEVRHLLAGKTEVERCVTCHAPETHPPVRGHEVVAEACTPCHNGMGRGITTATAHMAGEVTGPKGRGKRHAHGGSPAGFSGETPDGLLAGDEVSAGCVRCHPPQRLAEDAAAVQGWRLFTERACGRCHQIDQVSTGGMGPDLSQIGDIRAKEALMAQINAPQATGLYSLMPRLPLQDEQRRQLALYLKGQSRLPLRPAGYRVERPLPENPVARFGCAGCHKYNGSDGGAGPDLDQLAAMRTPEWISDFLRAPEALRPGARMPALAGTAEVKLVVEQLMAKKPGQYEAASPLKIYEQLCARCHGQAGDGMGLIALNLSGAPRRFLENSGYFRLRERDKLASSVKKGIPGTAMPPFAKLLDDRQIDALLDDILRRFVGLNPAGQSADLSVPTRPAGAQKSGAALYASWCDHCHGEKGDRALSRVHKRFPQPRNFRNRAYLEAVTDEQLFRAIARGIPGTRMKAYQKSVPGTGVRVKAGLPDDDVWRLVDHVRGLSKK